MFNNIWSNACLCSVVYGLVLVCVQYTIRSSMLSDIVQSCLMIFNIWSCSDLCSIVSVLVLVCVQSSACMCSVVSGLVLVRVQ